MWWLQPVPHSSDALTASWLKDAELVGATREWAEHHGKPTFGKQRSASHIATMGPVIQLDFDSFKRTTPSEVSTIFAGKEHVVGDVLDLEQPISLFGAAAVIYTSHSYGHEKKDKEGNKRIASGGRVELIGDRKLAPEEYRLAQEAINHLLGGRFDPHGNSPSLCYGGYARRNEASPCKRVIIEGAALNYDTLIELGQSLTQGTEYKQTWTSKTDPGRRRSLTEYRERVLLMGAVRPPDAYEDWYVAAGAFKREFPNDMEMAFALFDAYAACSKEYDGTETCSKKFDQVPIEYKGDKVPVTLSILHTRTKRRAIKIIEALYGPQRTDIADALKNLAPSQDLGAGIDEQNPPKGGEFVSPDSVKPEDGLTALEYLLYCHSDKSIEGLHVPPHILKQAQKRTEERSRRVILNGRTLAPPWNGQDAHASLIALGEALIASGVPLFKVDNLLVLADDPMSDPALAQKVRDAYEYKGPAGGPEDPALGGVHLVPLDTDDLRILFDKHVAVEKTFHKKDGGTYKRIVSHPFNKKETAEGPDRQGLKHLYKHDLPTQVREVLGVVTAPVMPNLPATTRPEDLLRENAGHVLTKPGYDPASRLFLAPNGIVEPVPDNPTGEDVVAATNLLRLPFYDSPSHPQVKDSTQR